MTRLRLSRRTLNISRRSFLTLTLGSLGLVFYFHRGSHDPYALSEYTQTERPGSWIDHIAPANSYLSSWGGSVSTDEQVLDFGDDGLVYGWENLHEKLADSTVATREKRQLRELAKKHPIERLIERGEKRWANLLAR